MFVVCFRRVYGGDVFHGACRDDPCVFRVGKKQQAQKLRLRWLVFSLKFPLTFKIRLDAQLQAG